MQLTQSFQVTHPPGTVWAFLGDVRAVAACLPGAEITEVGEDKSIQGRMNVRFGPMNAAFTGDGAVERDAASMTGTISGRGMDRQSRSQCRGYLSYRLMETAGGGTEVAVDVDYTLTGALAQFSRGGLINDLAQRLTDEFAAALEAALASSADNAASAESCEEADRDAKVESLDAGGLLSAVIWARIKAFYERIFSRA